MSADLGKVCSAVLRNAFGDIVQIVGDCLFNSSARTLNAIVKATGLNRAQVKISLAVLIKYHMVTFCQSSRQPNIAEYSIKPDHVLNLQRTGRYLHCIWKKYGGFATLLAEEVLEAGSICASRLVYNCISKAGNKERAETYRDLFVNLLRDNYLIRMPYAKKSADKLESSPACTVGTKRPATEEDSDQRDPVPILSIEPYELFMPPDIDFHWIATKAKSEADDTQPKDADILWRLNFIRFHQDLRDDLLVNAIERKLGASTGECFRYILQKMYERTDPWFRHTSNPFTFNEIKQAIDKTSNNLDLIRYLEQYMGLIAEDSLGFIRKMGDSGGGQYVVEMSKAMEELALASIERIITERLSSKATRIFRVIRYKKNIEQEELQKEAMIPGKEAKLLAYNLFREQFVHLRTIRKAGGGGGGPARAYYLFHIRTKYVVKMLLDLCYKAFYNNLTRYEVVRNANINLIEKADKVECIVTAMKERNEPEASITEILETLALPEREILTKVRKQINMFTRADIALEDTIFLLEMYLYHAGFTLPPTKT